MWINKLVVTDRLFAYSCCFCSVDVDYAYCLGDGDDTEVQDFFTDEPLKLNNW